MNKVFTIFSDFIFSRTVKGTSWLLFGNVISALFGIIFVIFAARFLGPEGWGLVAAVTGLIPILISLTDLGVNASFFQYAAGRWTTNKEDAQKAYRTALAIRLLTLGVTFFFLIVLAKQISELAFGSKDFQLAIFAAIGLVGVSLSDFQVFAIQSKQSWKLASAFISAVNIIRVVCIFFLWQGNLITVQSVLISYVGSSFILFFISLFWLSGIPKLEGGWRDLTKSFASFSAWMAGNKIVSTISSRVDVLILIQLAGSFETGIYAAANRLAMGVPLVAGSFATVLAARFAAFNEIDQVRSFFKKSVALSSIFAGGIVAGIFLSPFIISFFGEEYQRSVQVLQWLLVAIIPLALSTPAVVVLIYYFKKPEIVTYMAVVQLVIVIFVNYVFIPSLGIWAPVWAVGISQFLTTTITYFYALKYLYK